MNVARRDNGNGHTPQSIFAESVKLADLPKIIREYRRFLKLTPREGFRCSVPLIADDGTGFVYLDHEQTAMQHVTIIDVDHLIIYSFWDYSIAEILCNGVQIICYSQLTEDERKKI